MRIEPSAPCPHCRAENMAHRRICWRCKRTLPTSFALDAELRHARTRLSAPAEPVRPSRADIDAALEQAIIIGQPPEQEEEEPFPEGEGNVGKRLLWLLGKRTHA